MGVDRRRRHATQQGHYIRYLHLGGHGCRRHTAESWHRIRRLYLGVHPEAGKRTPIAVAAGIYTWASTAVGDTPPNRGTASGAYTWASSAAGTKTSRGTHIGHLRLGRHCCGRPCIPVERTPAPTPGLLRQPGATSMMGYLLGIYTWADTMTLGARASRGTATGTYTWSSAAAGIAPVVGAKQGGCQRYPTHRRALLRGY